VVVTAATPYEVLMAAEQPQLRMGGMVVRVRREAEKTIGTVGIF
jgi:hypothetical protein